MATIIKDFDLSFAPGYLETVEMIDCEKTPRHQASLTLPLVRLSLLRKEARLRALVAARTADGGREEKGAIMSSKAGVHRWRERRRNGSIL